MHMFLRLSAAVFVAAPLSCRAALLRPFSQITASTVHLADLFDDLGSAPDRVLGAAPAPGTRIVVAAPQLAAIARDFNVAWRPASGDERAVIERRGDVLSRAAIAAALRLALAEAGAPDDADVVSPDLQPIVVPAGSTAAPDISQLSYDAPTGRFSAMLSVPIPEMAGVQVHVAGQVVAMVRTAIATHRLAPGSVLGEADVQVARVRLSSLHGAAPLTALAALGLSIRHDIQAGQPLTTGDLTRLPLVLRGMRVRMRLDSDGIALVAQGVAAEPGARGDRIHVENPNSHLLVEAEVIGAGEVRVAPRAALTLAAAQ